MRCEEGRIRRRSRHVPATAVPFYGRSVGRVDGSRWSTASCRAQQCSSHTRDSVCRKGGRLELYFTEQHAQLCICHVHGQFTPPSAGLIAVMRNPLQRLASARNATAKSGATQQVRKTMRVTREFPGVRLRGAAQPQRLAERTLGESQAVA